MFALSLAKQIVSKVAPAAQAVVSRTVAVAKALDNRRSIRRLGDAEERLLKDIGLTRGDVSAALDTPFYADPSANLALHSGGRGAASAAFASGSASLRRADASLMVAR